MHDCSMPIENDGTYLFDARGIAKRVRHAAIFGALEALIVGERLRFCNDHDPIPLLSQIRGYYGPRVRYDYVSRDPGQIVIDFVIC